MSDLTELVRLSSSMENTLQILCTLGIEYQAKAITPERFAERVHGILVQFQKDTYGKPNAAEREQGEKK